MSPISTLRAARPDDTDAIAAIYDHHARHGTATFDLVGPPASVWSEKMAGIVARGWPFVVAETNGVVSGFAYVSPFRDRAAYAPCCEDSIYVADSARGSGVGTALLEALVSGAKACGLKQMVAVIGGAEPASVAVHRRCGFVDSGSLVAVGEKFGQTLDVTLMQRAL